LNSELIFLILSTVFLLLGMIVTYWVHNQYQIGILISKTSPPISSATPLISIIIPARDEARNIRRCLAALSSQTYPNLEIIVVDDRSSDATPQILEEIIAASQDNHLRGGSPPLTVVHGEDLPAGWAGKPHALAQGYAIAQGDWLCFIDADTFASPDLIASTFRAANSQQADLLTILTYQELISFWEKVILPLVFTALSVGFPVERVNDPNKPDAIANGQFILIRRAVYEAVGGHRAIRGEIAEDKALAALVKGNGYRLVLGDGRDLARTRMYTSLPEIWEGWTKNIYLGLQDRLWLLATGAVVGLIGALVLPLWTILSLSWIVNGGGWIAYLATLESLSVWIYLLYYRLQACRAMEISPGYAFSLPLGAFVFTMMMFTSAYNVLSGKGVTWRGRSYS
jgi:chlorobactene glucosyltransferase